MILTKIQLGASRFWQYLLLAALTSPLFALAQPFNPTDKDYILKRAEAVINWTIAIVVGLGTLIFFWGIVQYVIAQGDEKKIAEGRKYMLWGVVGLAVMVAVWGFAQLIIFTIFGTTSFITPTAPEVP